jgi:hypothetical protein
MAGILKCDQVQSDSNLAFNIAGSNVAFMNATSLQMVGSNVSLAGTNVITNGKVVASGMPTGAVLQVVSAVITTSTSTTSTSFVQATTTATITPQFSTSKIYIMVSGPSFSGGVNYAVSTLYRNNTTNLGSSGYSGFGITGNNPATYDTQVAFNYLDSPALMEIAA